GPVFSSTLGALPHARRGLLLRPRGLKGPRERGLPARCQHADRARLLAPGVGGSYREKRLAVEENLRFLAAGSDRKLAVAPAQILVQDPHGGVGALLRRLPVRRGLELHAANAAAVNAGRIRSQGRPTP